MFNAKSMKRNIAYFECDTTKYIQVNVIVFYKGFLNSGIKKMHCPTVCTIGRMFIFGGFECKCKSVFHVRESHDPSNVRRLNIFLMP